MKSLTRFVKRSHTAAKRDWIEKYKLKDCFFTKGSLSEFIIDKTQIKVGTELI